ncbi:hypothetical protein [Leekyejoonella antrihumi]|uniref:hypothetical protein n=1 Tax=Leekyejoonella antrihumi TaxID=1660198 RepID=UPI0016470F5D|nr:hypothetical protein [Leekyejoonella antrihumi]
MNPLTTQYVQAQVDYRRERVAEDMAAAGWSRATRSLGARVRQITHHESREEPSIRCATAH